MPTFVTHTAVAVAGRLGLSRHRLSARLGVAGAVASMAPDLDAIGYWLGVPYGSLFGHRGFSHSLAAAVLLGALAALFAAALRSRPAAAFLFVSVCAASHGLLDAMTSGGLGVAFFSPLSNARYFLPLRPIRVAPLGLRGFLSPRGIAVVVSEVRYVWAPLFAAALAARLLVRRPVAPTRRSTRAKGPE